MIVNAEEYSDLIESLESQFKTVLLHSDLQDCIKADIKIILDKLEKKVMLKSNDQHSMVNFIFKPSLMGQPFNKIHNHIINLHSKTTSQVEVENKVRPILLEIFMQYLILCIEKKEGASSEEISKFLKQYNLDYFTLKTEFEKDLPKFQFILRFTQETLRYFRHSHQHN